MSSESSALELPPESPERPAKPPGNTQLPFHLIRPAGSPPRHFRRKPVYTRAEWRRIQPERVRRANLEAFRASLPPPELRHNMSKLKAKLVHSPVPQYHVAAECGIHPYQLSCYSNGKKAIRYPHLVTLCEWFQCEPEELLGESDEEDVIYWEY